MRKAVITIVVLCLSAVLGDEHTHTVSSQHEFVPLVCCNTMIHIYSITLYHYSQSVYNKMLGRLLYIHNTGASCNSFLVVDNLQIRRSDKENNRGSFIAIDMVVMSDFHRIDSGRRQLFVYKKKIFSGPVACLYAKKISTIHVEP